MGEETAQRYVSATLLCPDDIQLHDSLKTQLFRLVKLDIKLGSQIQSLRLATEDSTADQSMKCSTLHLDDDEQVLGFRFFEVLSSAFALVMLSHAESSPGACPGHR